MKRVLLTALVLAAGCFNVDERPCTFSCGPNGECPDDYQCLKDGYCHLHGDTTSCGYSDLSVVDVAPPEDLSALDGPVVQPDAGAVNGTACTSGSQCLSGHCADGVCCNNACTSACNA